MSYENRIGMRWISPVPVLQPGVFFSPEHRNVIDSAILVIEPGRSIPARKGIKNGQELLCILQGSLELVHGESTVKMSKGDSVHFWSAKEQQEINNRNNERAVALWIGTL